MILTDTQVVTWQAFYLMAWQAWIDEVGANWDRRHHREGGVYYNGTGFVSNTTGLCTAFPRACNLTAAGKNTNQAESEHEATYQASQ